MNEFNIPIYSAVGINGKETFEGYLVPRWTTKGKEQRYNIDLAFEYDWEGESVSVEEIDPSTLKMSFDNGKSWRNIYMVKLAIVDHDRKMIDQGKEPLRSSHV